MIENQLNWSMESIVLAMRFCWFMTQNRDNHYLNSLKVLLQNLNCLDANKIVGCALTPPGSVGPALCKIYFKQNISTLIWIQLLCNIFHN
jgi:hypothetical protein